MQDTKLKATNKQATQTSKQKLIDTDNSMVVTRGKEGKGTIKGKGVRCILMEDLALGSKHIMLYTGNSSCHPNKFNLKTKNKEEQNRQELIGRGYTEVRGTRRYKDCIIL